MAPKREFCRCCGRLIDGHDPLDFERTEVARATRLCVWCDMDGDELAEFENTGESPTHIARMTRELERLSKRYVKGAVIGPCEAVTPHPMGQCRRKATFLIKGRKFCACHQKQAQKGSVRVISEPAKIQCFVVADSLEAAMKQVKEAWNAKS